MPVGYLPPAGSNGVRDELLGGMLQRRGWLGRPLGPFPDLAPRRLEATAGQDPRVNSGVVLRAPVTVPPQDAWFLRAERRP